MAASNSLLASVLKFSQTSQQICRNKNLGSINLNRLLQVGAIHNLIPAEVLNNFQYNKVCVEAGFIQNFKEFTQRKDANIIAGYNITVNQLYKNILKSMYVDYITNIVILSPGQFEQWHNEFYQHDIFFEKFGFNVGDIKSEYLKYRAVVNDTQDRHQILFEIPEIFIEMGASPIITTPDKHVLSYNEFVVVNLAMEHPSTNDLDLKWAYLEYLKDDVVLSEQKHESFKKDCVIFRELSRLNQWDNFHKYAESLESRLQEEQVYKEKHGVKTFPSAKL